MSFNIRYGSAPDGDLAWRHRKGRLLERIRWHAPDLLGIQECRADGQLADLAAGLPGYAYFGVPRGGGSESALEMAPVFYCADVFERVDAGAIWLSDAPFTAGSVSWGSTLPRTLTWVLLDAPGCRIWFGNAHFDHLSAEARKRSAEMIVGILRDRPAGEIRILTGDFNTIRGSGPHRILTRVLADPIGVDERAGSFHGFGMIDPPVGIDWVLASPELRIARAWIDSARPGGLYLSDHDPVVVEVDLGRSS